MTDRSLPAKFTDDEREAYGWLLDSGCTGWMVDLATKRVRYLDGDDAKTANDLCELCDLFMGGDWDGNVPPDDDAYPRCRICGGDSVDHHGRNCDDCRANHDNRKQRT